MRVHIGCQTALCVDQDAFSIPAAVACFFKMVFTDVGVKFALQTLTSPQA